MGRRYRRRSESRRQEHLGLRVMRRELSPVRPAARPRIRPQRQADQTLRRWDVHSLTALPSTNETPKDSFKLASSSPPSGSPASDYSPDVENFAAFMRMSAPPTPAADTSSTINGRQIFTSIGRATCHVPKQTTRGGVDFFPYSDFRAAFRGQCAGGRHHPG